MTQAILHIGAGKCGSSALQTAFSEHPQNKSLLNPAVNYATILSNGNVVHGPKLTKSAQTLVYGYHSSISAKRLAELSASGLQKISSKLSEISGNNGKVLLSNEGWINEAALFQKSNLIKEMNLSCDVIVYVRPPVEWINSAWWQWGAWADVPMHRWIKRALELVSWHDRISPWLNLEGVNNVIVRLLPKDIVADFCESIQIPTIMTNRSNPSLPGTVLRLFQRNRNLRPSPHESEIDFAIARHLRVKEPTPWILKPKSINWIMEATRKSNERLLELLDGDSKKIIEQDLRWWDASAFDQKNREPIVRNHLKVKDLEVVAVDALRAIWRLEAENRKLRSKLSELT